MLEQTADLSSLRRALHGTLVTPDDAAYETARQVFNAAIDRRPVAVVRAADVHDVQVVVAAARDQGLPLAVRSGKHGFVGRRGRR